MEPIEFLGHNIVIAKDQPEYRGLPAYVVGDATTFCWKLTFKERLKLLWTGELWHTVLTFGRPLQPQLPSVDIPFDVRLEQSKVTSG